MNVIDIMKKYRYTLLPQEWEVIKNEIIADGPSEIAIDTETNGLDPVYSKPYQLIVGWYDKSKIYKHYIIHWPTAEANPPEVVELMKWIESTDILTIFHNAKFDIEMIQNWVGDWYRPKFFCTLLALAHSTKFLVYGLKPLATTLKLRSRFAHIDEIWEQVSNPDITNEQKASVLTSAVESGLIPQSSAVMNNINKLKNGIPEGLNYFNMLFNKPDDLVEFYKEVLTSRVEEKFKPFAEARGWTGKTLAKTYDLITNVYSIGAEYDKAREILREFNKEAFGATNEWIRLFKGKASQLHNISYEVLNEMDPAAITMYAGMDGKLTLDLYAWIKANMEKTGWTEEQQKVLDIEFDAVYPIIMQEKVGFNLDIDYINESLIKSKDALLKINKAISEKFDYITAGNNWKEELGMSKDELLQANNYNQYNKLFETYVPYLPLPVFIDNKSSIQLGKVSKLLAYIEMLRPYQIDKHQQNLREWCTEIYPKILDNTATEEEVAKYNKWIEYINTDLKLEYDRELAEAFEEANSEHIITQIVGEDGKGGMFETVFTAMFNTANKAVADRQQQIEEKGLNKAGNPKLKMRKEELAIQDALATSKDAIELIQKLYEGSAKCKKAGNKAIESKFTIKVTPAKRTLNKETTVPLTRVEIDKLDITDEQRSIAFEAQEIVRMKKTEATLLKWIGTYMIKLLGGVGESPDNRLRTNYLMFKAVTGRLSCDVHQFPKGGVKDPFDDSIMLYEPRRAFLATPLPEFGNEEAIIAYEDFSQMELRVAAEYTLRYGVPDLALMQAYIPWGMYHPEHGLFNIELHRDIWNSDTVRTWNAEAREWEFTYNWYSDPQNMNAETMWEPTDLHLAPVKVAFPHMFDENGNPLEEFKDQVKKYRNVCKALNFGGLYGQGLSGLLGDSAFADFSREILVTLYNAHKETYQNLKKFQRKVMQFVRKYGHISNLFGRKYIKGFPWGKDKFGEGYQYAYRGTNYLIQGECATLLKDRMVAMEKYIYDNNLKAKLLQNIHDEVAIIMPVSEKEHIFHLRDIIQDSPWKVNMVSDIEVTVTTWADKAEVISMEDIDKVIEETIHLQK